MIKKDTPQTLLSGWIRRGIINRALNELFGVNLFVMVWGLQTTPWERALYVLVSEAVTVFWSGLGESVLIRAFIMRHYTRILWSLVILDNILLPVFVASPYWYLIIFTLLFDGLYFLAFVTMQDEVKEVLLTEPNARNSYNARKNKAIGIGSILGCLLSMVIPVASWGVIPMIILMIFVAFSCVVNTYRIFRRTTVYMKANDLEFHCSKQTPESGASIKSDILNLINPVKYLQFLREIFTRV